MIKPELLSPAGNFLSLKYAVYNGADAVYLGLDKFSARGKAENFNISNIKQCIDFAHFYGVKVYVAFNTIIKNSEIPDFLKLLDIAAEAKADAFILQSFGIAELVKKIYPNAVLHASTQAGIHNRYGAQLCKEVGFERIILSRECTAEDIKDITDNVDIEVEAFIHGALCTSFSGGCYMSSFISCNSGNRGLCLQPCRKNYTAYDGKKRLKEGCLLSLPDLCMENDIDLLIKNKVTSLKIEGRLKRPEYTAAVTKLYRNIIDNKKISENDLYAVKAAYSRGDYTKGFCVDKPVIPYIKHQGHSGVFVGKVLKVYKDTLEIKSNKPLSDGDGFKLFSEGIECGNAIFFKDLCKEIYLLKYKGKVNNNTEVYITTDNSINNAILADIKKLKIDITFTAILNKPCVICFNYQNISVKVNSDYIVQQGITAITENKDIQEKLKINDEIFYNDTVTVELDDNIFIPLSVLKKIKNEGLLKLKQCILNQYKTVNYTKSNYLHSTMQSQNNQLSAKKACIINNSQHMAVCKDAYAYIFKPDNYTEEDFNNFFNGINNDIISKIYLYLPPLCLVNDLNLLKILIKKFNIKNLYINNPFGYYFAKELCCDVFLGAGLNIYNDYDIEFAKKYGDDYTYSAELSYSEIKNINDKTGFITVYGNIDVMTVAACLIKPIYNSDCKKCCYTNIIEFKDEKKESFYIKRYKLSNCYFNVINGKKLNFLKKEIPKGNMLYNFTDEKTDVVKDLYNLKQINGEFTSGHMYRGIK